MDENIICCPNCNRPAEILDGSIQCINCGFSYLKENNILDFLPGNRFYWGEISQEKMRQINERAQVEGDWYKVVNEQLADKQDFIQYFTDTSRLGWLFHCYRPDQNSVCVDLGSGLGSLSFILSRFFDDVYSVDGVLDRLKFQVIRAKEEEISNIHFIRSPLLKLPFQDASVDLVIVNGVLEWIGLSDFSEKPDKLQSLFLQEVSRILKPNGILYLGIENRFGAQCFLGRKDHSGIPFTSLLPRKIASWVMRFLYHQPHKNPRFFFPGFEKGYRTYTYSIWGYEKILRESGFQYIDPNWTWPTYSFPKYSGPIDGDSVRHFFGLYANRFEKNWMRLLSTLLLNLPHKIIQILQKIFTPEFLFIASKTPLSSTLPHCLYENYPEMKSFMRMTTDNGAELSTTFHLTDEKVRVVKTIRFKECKDVKTGQSKMVPQNF